MINFHYKYESLATICVREHLEQIAYGVVNFKNEKVISIEEKPIFRNYVNAGIYLFSPEAISLVPKNTYCDMTDFIKFLIIQIKIFSIQFYIINIFDII